MRSSRKRTPKTNELAEQFELLAKQLEKSLGVGRKKIAGFVGDFSQILSPVLDKLEEKLLSQKIFPVEAIPNLMKAFLKEITKLFSIDFKKMKKGKRGKDEFGMDANSIEKIRPFFQFLYCDYWRVRTVGLSNIPKKGRCLLVANHSGGLPYDGSIISVACLNEHPANRFPRALIEDFIYQFPLLGNFMSRIGAVPASKENAAKLLQKGELVLVFPEGVEGLGKLYRDRYQLQQFGHGGFIKLAIRTQTPIIPVAVIGAEEIHPILWKSYILADAFGVPYLPVTPTFPLLGPLGLIPLPSRWKIVFGKPISFKQYKPLQANNEKLVEKLTESIRSTIQKIIDREIKKRKSAWLG